MKMIRFREMCDGDQAAVIGLMEQFYHSNAVSTNGSARIFARDFAACLSDSPFLRGYVFEQQNEVVGYAMLAFSFCTEFGKPCVWIEDIYLRENARGKGAASTFIGAVKARYPDHVLRLEVEHDNTVAARVYQAQQFRFLPYAEMIAQTGEA